MSGLRATSGTGRAAVPSVGSRVPRDRCAQPPRSRGTRDPTGALKVRSGRRCDGARRSERQTAGRGRRREAALQGDGRYSDQAMQAAFADECRAREKRRFAVAERRPQRSRDRKRANVTKNAPADVPKRSGGKPRRLRSNRAHERSEVPARYNVERTLFKPGKASFFDNWLQTGTTCKHADKRACVVKRRALDRHVHKSLHDTQTGLQTGAPSMVRPFTSLNTTTRQGD